MYNCYNVAYGYLKDKYGVKRGRLTDSFLARIRHFKAREYKAAIANATDSDYYTYVQVPDDAPEVDRAVYDLLGLYSTLSMAPRKLLWELLIAMNLMPATSNPLD